MRLISTLLCLTVLLTGCTSDQKKAEKLVEAYLKENLKDPDSYQNIEMERLEKLTWVGLFLADELKKVKAKELDIDGCGDRIAAFRAKMEAQGHNPDSLIGFTMRHQYRAKNSFGGYVKTHVEYTFDAKLESIIGTDEIE
jgi:hypothetical protein